MYRQTAGPRLVIDSKMTQTPVINMVSDAHKAMLWTHDTPWTIVLLLFLPVLKSKPPNHLRVHGDKGEYVPTCGTSG